MKSKDFRDKWLQDCTVIPKLYMKVTYMLPGNSGEHSKAIEVLQEYRIQSSKILHYCQRESA